MGPWAKRALFVFLTRVLRMSKKRISSVPDYSSIFHKIEGPIVLLGFGSIARGLLPLLERHFAFDRERFVVIDPRNEAREQLEKRGFRFIEAALTPSNYREIVLPLLQSSVEKPGFCINASVNVASLALVELAQEAGAFYIDASVELWSGLVDETTLPPAERTNYAVREEFLALREKFQGKKRLTAVTSCGANPGTVSWFVKQALLRLAQDLELEVIAPSTRQEWAALMQQAGVKGVHVSEFDGQRTPVLKKKQRFLNTWSVEGLIAECWQPAELGIGTHERWLPETAREYEFGTGCAAYLMQPGATTRVFSWCPGPGPKQSLMIAHYESVSLPDYFSVRDGEQLVYRPTVHYAYRPSNAALLSLKDYYGAKEEAQKEHVVLGPDEIAEGTNELGVLLYGHAKNAYWYGSRLSIDQVRELVPDQNATGLQVTSALLAGMVWALENPHAGLVEPEDMDHERCLQIQSLYLGSVEGHYTDWNPLQGRQPFFPEDLDHEDPWQLKNTLIRL